jgi:4-hydroxybenzoyl-CoA thioesterase
LPQLYRAHGLKGFPLLDARAKFSAASAFGDWLDCESGVSEWSDKTLKVRHRFRRGGSLMVDGWELRVCAVPHPEDPQRIKAAPIPDMVKDRLGDDGTAV